MTREDLFLAIGQVESSRLSRSELSSLQTEEDKTMYTKPRRTMRNLVAAVLTICMLAVTAYAAAGYLLFDSPEDMISAIFGDKTGFDHSDGSIRPDPYEPPTGIIVEPTYDRVPADEEAVEDLTAFVSPIGQSIQWNGFTLTVDSFLYDSATKCGFFTYLLENPNGLPEYRLQSTGEIWYDGVPDIVDVNQYGYPYIIQEKTTETCLAATYYFRWDERHGEELEICMESGKRYTPDEFAALIEEDIQRLKQELSPEEIVAREKEIIGEESFSIAFQGLTEEEIVEQCYSDIAGRTAAEHMEQEGTSDVIRIPLNDEQQALHHKTACNGDVVITPVSIAMDIRNMAFLHTDKQGNSRVDTDNVDSVVIRFTDGTDYTVYEGNTVNYAFCVTDMPEENVQTEVYVSPEEDPYGEGYMYVENSIGYCLLTTMFNRIIDLDEVTAVVINGVELPLDN